nr:MAG TPA: plasmid partition protein ParG-helix-helix, dimer, DNA binding, CELL [Caudoviricetes sp.]
MPRKGVKMSEEALKKNAAASAAWHKKNTEALSIRVRREKADAYRELARRREQSLSSIVWTYLDAECEKEGIAIG